MSTANRAAVIGFLFVLSGLLGLVYQVVWFRYLAAFLGNTTHAQAIVLSVFMGGLAIGAWLWGHRSDAIRSPLRLYGYLELGVGAFCAAYPLLLSLLRSAFISTMVSFGWVEASAGVVVAKLVVSAVTLLPPTILMGGTLPVLVRAITRRLDNAGQIVATLYALNSMGAVIGAVLAGFFAVRLIGMQSTMIASAILSCAIGVAALVLDRFDKGAGSVADTRPDEGKVYTQREGMTAVTIAALSGCAAMILEVTWVRMLVPVLGSSTYSFTLMLVAFISGITLGGMFVSRRIDRSPNLPRLLAGSQAGILLSVVALFPLYERMPYLLWSASSMLMRSESTYPVFLALQFLFGFLWMFLPTFFFGVSLPVAVRIASRSGVDLGSSVGRVYTFNTTGTVVGSLLAGFVLIPAVGLRGSLVAAMLLVSSGIALHVYRAETPSRRERTALSAVVALGMLLILFFPVDTRLPSLAGVFRLINKNATPPPTFADFRRVYGQPEVLMYEEGSSATVSVLVSHGPEGEDRVLVINGKSDASSRGDLPTQVLLGQIPALLHGAPKDALVIGYGSGVTAGSLLTHDVERVECVEIVPEVLLADTLFQEVNHRPLSDGRFHLFIDDALSFLAVTPRQYDIIVSEPSNPWIAGIGSLFTTEFFDRCRNKLRPGGIMAQWFHLYEVDEQTFQLVMRTFTASFPYVTVWESMTSDVVLLGSDAPIDLDESRLAALMKRPAVAEDLERIKMKLPSTLLSLQMMSNKYVREYAGDGVLNTEDLPYLEYRAPMAFFVNRGVGSIDMHDERLMKRPPDIYLTRKIAVAPLSGGEVLDAGLYHAEYRRGHPLLGYFLLTSYLRDKPNDVPALRSLANVCVQLNKRDEELGFLKRLTVLLPDDASIHLRYGWGRFAHDTQSRSSFGSYNTEEAELHIRKAIALTGDTVDTYRVRLADVMYNVGRFAQAMDQYARALQIRELFASDPNIAQDMILSRLAQCLYVTGQRSRALGFALLATQNNPGNQEARELIYTLWNEGTSVDTMAGTKKP